MGNEQVTTNNFKRSEWNRIDSKSNFEILSNANDSIELQEYTRNFFDSSQLKNEMKLYKLREEHQNYVVRLLHAKIQRSNSCSQSAIVKVVTQRIPNILSSYDDLDESKGYQILQKSLKGYHQLSKKRGCNYKINNNMIGMNRANQVRVWLNRDFSKNVPQIQLWFDKSGQHDLICSIFNSVEQSLQNKQYPQYFSQEKSVLQTPYNFEDSIKFVEKIKKNHLKLKKENNSFSNDPIMSLPSYKPPGKVQKKYPQSIFKQNNFFNKDRKY